MSVEETHKLNLTVFFSYLLTSFLIVGGGPNDYVVARSLEEAYEQARSFPLIIFITSKRIINICIISNIDDAC